MILLINDHLFLNEKSKSAIELTSVVVMIVPIELFIVCGDRGLVAVTLYTLY